MTSVVVKFDHEIREKIKKGIETLAQAVKTTMGPKGKTVLIERKGQHPIVTKDGVTVAKSINLSDGFQNLGVQVVKEAASRSADEAGDGTTTATVLTQALYDQGLRYISAGIDSVIIRKGIENAVDDLVLELKNIAKPIESDDDINNIALISCNNEKEIADLISSAIKRVGVDGSIIVEEAKGFNSDLKIVEGFQVDRGYLSPYFITDEDKSCALLEKCYVLLINRKINNLKEIIKPLELSLESGRPMLIVANDIDNEALQGLVLNRLKGNLKVCAIKSPGFGEARHDMMHDLATLTKAKVIDHSDNMDEFDENYLGNCKKVVIDRISSMFISDNEEIKKDVTNRINNIKEKLSSPTLDPNEREVLNYRAQRLAGGVAILRIGASTEAEMIERRDRVDDALHATRAALQEGTLPGGGIALITASSRINSKTKEDDIGYEIVKQACLEPIKQIVKNCGKSSDLVIETIREKNNPSFGYDSRNEIYGDMYDLGVIDPLKVVRCAIQNSSSAATLLLTSDCAMIEEK